MTKYMMIVLCCMMLCQNINCSSCLPDRLMEFPENRPIGLLTIKTSETSETTEQKVITKEAKGSIFVPKRTRVSYSYSAKYDKKYGNVPTGDYSIDTESLSKLNPYSFQSILLSHLNSNNISLMEIMNSLENQKSIYSVQLTECNFEPSEMNFLDTHPTIKSLNMNRCVSQTPFSALKHPLELESLEIIKGNYKSVFIGMKIPNKIKIIYLFDVNAITDSEVAVIGNMRQLRELHMESMKHVTAVGIHSISQLDCLEVLRLGGMPLIKSRDYSFISSLINLREIHIYDSDFSDVELKYLLPLKKLECVDFQNTCVTNNGVLNFFKKRTDVKIKCKPGK